MLTDKQLTDIVITEFEEALGIEGQDISRERHDAYDRYMGEMLGNEVEGESEALTADLAKIVDGLMPSLIRMFTSADNLVSFDPVGPEDRPQAEQESDYVNYVFFKDQEDAFLILFFWFFDTLMYKNGYVMAFWDETEVVTQESYTGLMIEEVTILLDDAEKRTDVEMEPIERSENPDGTHDVTFRRVDKSGKVTVDNVPPDEMRVSRDSRRPETRTCRFRGREREMTRSELVEMGFDKKFVYELAPQDAKEHTRPRNQADHRRSDNPDTTDKSQQKILVQEAYLKVDMDEDGRAELRQVFLGGGKLLKWADSKRGTKGMAQEVVDRDPFHTLTAYPVSHQHHGQSVDDKWGDNQEITTTLLRETLNNLYHSTKVGHAVWDGAMGENTLDDLLTNRTGRVVRFARPLGDAYAPLSTPFVAGDVFPMLEYYDREQRERYGLAGSGEGLEPDALKHIQQTVFAEQNDIARMKQELVVRVIAETGLKSLFRHIHELLQKHQDKQRVVELRDQFVPVNPSEWRTRMNMTVRIGLGIATRERNMLHLNNIFEKQTAIVGTPGQQIIDQKTIFNTMSEMVKNANLKVPGDFFKDPGDVPFDAPTDEQQQLEQAQLELDQRQQKLDEQRHQVAMAKVQLQAQSEQLDHQRAMMKMEADFSIAQEKLRNDLVKLSAELEAEQDPLKRAKLRAEVEETLARAMAARAQAAQAATQARANQVETDAQVSGVVDALEELNASEEEVETEDAE